MTKAASFIQLLRPTQWIKNIFVFAAAIFANQMFHPVVLGRTILAFIAFSLTSSIIYILNDWNDRENDRYHPEKKHRPLASGLVRPAEAVWIGLFLLICVVFINLVLGGSLWIVLLVYAFMNLGYTLYFKHVVILDIIIVSVGFILRAVAGGVVISVVISKWLLLCTFFLALFLILNKRRAEFVILGSEAKAHRHILADYSLTLLDQIIAIVAGLTIIAYSLYTMSPMTIEKFHTENLVYTVPFVVFGLFRYLYLVNKKQLGGRPEKIVLTDRSIQACILLWVVCAIWVIY